MALKLVLVAAFIAASQASVREFPYEYLEPFSSPLAFRYTEPSYNIPIPAIRNYGYVEPVAPIIKKITQVPIVSPVTKTVVSPAPAHYDFGYSVSDPYAALHQSRVESRRGDVVKGSYALLEADGTKRIVDYVATPLDGFKAVVRKEPFV